MTLVPPTRDELGYDPGKVLFVGLGQSAVCWYRIALPAMFMGADWIGLNGTPGGRMHLVTGLAKGNTEMPDFSDYDVVIVQQPRGRGWLGIIRQLQERGIKVLFEIDDYVHGIRRMGKDHDYAEFFNKDALAELELNMKVCDAVVASTEYVGRRYRSFNKIVYVCENGLDTARYNLTRPPRPTVNIGWAGATGHKKGMLEWMNYVQAVMVELDEACFVSIGQNYADLLKPRFPRRSIAVPFTLVDTYPAAMTMFDIGLAPSGNNPFFHGKSDLRWLEAGALGVPLIADPVVYPKIEHGVTGFHAASAPEAGVLMKQLVEDEDLRKSVGEAAREYVLSERAFGIAVESWIDMIRDVLDVD